SDLSRSRAAIKARQRKPRPRGVIRHDALSQCAGGDGLQDSVERLAEKDLQSFQDERAGCSGVEGVGAGGPEDREMGQAAETAIGAFGNGTKPRGLLGFLALRLGRDSAGIKLGPRVDLKLRIGA